MSRGDVIAETREQTYVVTEKDQTVATFNVKTPTTCFDVFQDDPDDMDDPFTSEQMNSFQIRWDSKRKEVQIFTSLINNRNLISLDLDYPTFFKEFRKWHQEMIKKHKKTKK